MENKDCPAFPNDKQYQLGSKEYEGLTKREYFALKMSEKINYTIHPNSFWDAIKLFSRRFGFHNSVHLQKNYSLKTDMEYCLIMADELLKQLESSPAAEATEAVAPPCP